MKNYSKEYKLLINQSKPLSQWQVRHLFNMALFFERQQEYGKKVYIYSQIEGHPKATDRHMFRVLVYKYDQLRRSGEFQKALNYLLPIRIPKNASLSEVFEFRQATAQAYVGLKNFTQAASELSALLTMDKIELLPIEKFALFLESYLSCKISCNEIDSDFKIELATFERLVLDGKFKNEERRCRWLGGYFHILGDLYRHNNDHMSAANFQYSHFITTTDQRSRVVAAMKCLFSKNVVSAYHDEMAEMLKLFVEKNHKILDKADKESCLDVWNFVKQSLSLEE